MTYSAQLFSLVVPLVLIGLIISSGIGLYRVRAFALPISTVTATATVILPVVTGISLRSAQTLTRRAKSWSSRPALAVVVFMLLVIYETAIATLALTHMAPPGNLSCGLDREWARLFSSKSAQTIRRIQDRHQCCGLHSVVDRAWPFPDKRHTIHSCVQAFDRQRSCFDGWRRDEQITAGLMLFVAVVAFLLKLLLLTVYRAKGPVFPAFWSSQRSHRTNDESCDPLDEDQNRHNIRGQIEREYHDDPLLEHGDAEVSSQGNGRAIDQAENRGPVVQPSGFQNEGSEWRQV